MTGPGQRKDPRPIVVGLSVSGLLGDGSLLVGLINQPRHILAGPTGTTCRLGLRKTGPDGGNHGLLKARPAPRKHGVSAHVRRGRLVQGILRRLVDIALHVPNHVTECHTSKVVTQHHDPCYSAEVRTSVIHERDVWSHCLVTVRGGVA